MRKPYDVILADPPWDFETWSENGNGRSACQHYKTMSFEDICSLSVQDIAAENSVLFMWVTGPCLEYGLEVIEAWDFEYKTQAFVWVKTNPRGIGIFMGNGYYTRANAELCLLATRGEPLPVAAHDVSQIILSPVREHSRKPDEQYTKIERLYPGKRYVELFARRARPGWKTWGLEAPDGVWSFI